MNKELIFKILAIIGGFTVGSFTAKKLSERKKLKERILFTKGYTKGYTDAAVVACGWFEEHCKEDSKKKGK